MNDWRLLTLPLLSFLQAHIGSALGEANGLYTNGNIIIGGVFPVHGEGTEEDVCASINRGRGIQRLEAMRFAIEEINRSEQLLKGVKLGMKILDTCSDDTYALDQSIEFVMSTLAASWSDDCPIGQPNNKTTEPRQPIVVVIGAAYSSVSIQMANLLRLFQIPQISYASTSAELSVKDDFFMRTVPPDTLQAKALVDIVSYFNWTYLSTVASDGNYGISGIDSFKKEYLKKTGQCIAIDLKVPKKPSEKEFLGIVKQLYQARSSSKAKVVILFVRQDHAEGILKAATTLGYYDDFIWLASDGWGNGMKPVQGNEKTAEGALTVTLKSNPIDDFDDYFKKLTPANNLENIWFKEYWEAAHNCTFARNEKSESELSAARYSKSTNEMAKRRRICYGNETNSDYKQESKVQFVFDAVYAAALGLDTLYREVCGVDADRLCEGMNLNSSMRAELNEYIRQNQKDDPYGNAIKFDENGDSLGFYAIMNYQKVNGVHDYVNVGTWEDNLLTLDLEKVVWPGVELPIGQVPMSFCSHDCELGYRKDMTDNKQCCWKCIKCEPNEYLLNEFTCERCREASWPHKNMTGCYELPVDYVKWNSPYAITTSIFSFIGLLATIFTIVVFVMHVETPIVKAAGRELSFMLLAGCAVCYTGVFVLLMKPTEFTCVMHRLFLGAGFSIIYSALLTKTNRIYRIFKSAKKTTKRPAYISPRSQLVIASALSSVQILVFAIWLIVEKPGVRKEVPDEDKNTVILKCNCKESSTLISLVYIMILIIVCTVYAVLTRKIPSSFNESKFIGFTMYTTCIIWLSFCPVYFSLQTSYQIQITTLCSAIILSATVALVCLFAPKLHIILFHPTKNKRKSTTERTKFSYGTSKQYKADTDNMASSPSRSRTPSIANPQANGTYSQKLLYEQRDAAIPEEINLLSTSSFTESAVESNSSKLSQDANGNNPFDADKRTSIENRPKLTERISSKEAMQLPYVDESEDSSYQLNLDLDLHKLKAKEAVSSQQQVSASKGQLPLSNALGDTQSRKSFPDSPSSNWTEGQSETDELPERLI